jgi:RNA ligase
VTVTQQKPRFDFANPHINDVIPADMYAASFDAGHIRVRLHTNEPYLIHNYAESCVWEQGWNTATLTCRGLITHAVTGEIIARPFPKFFNVGQPEAAIFNANAPVVVTEKVDGSLGILFPLTNGQWAISTRGSFHSEQAEWATQYYQRVHADFTPNPGWTYLFEIIYPENRIVLMYDFEGLVLLGAVNIATGVSIVLSEASYGWTGPIVQTHPFTSLAEVLTLPERKDCEGFVVHDPVTDVRVKVKHETYMRLHKLMTNTTERHVWEVIAAGESPAIIFAEAPDEFHQWIRIVESKMRKDFNSIHSEIVGIFDRVCSELNTTCGENQWQRREFAALAKKENHTSSLFTLLDGNDVSKNVWLSLKPVSETLTMKVVSPDAN